MKFASVLQKFTIAMLLAVSAAVAGAQSDPLTSLIGAGSQLSITAGTGPSLTVLNGTIYLAYKSNSSQQIYVASSTNGGASFTNPGTPIATALANTAPSITNWNGVLWVAYTNTSNNVYLMSSSDGGATWPNSIPVYSFTGSVQAQANSQPTIIPYDGYLFIVWQRQAPGSSTTFMEWTYFDGTTFGEGLNLTGACGNLTSQPQTGAGIGAAVFNNQLYFAYQAQGGNGWNHELSVCSVEPQASGTGSYAVYPTIRVGSGISALAYNGALYFAYKQQSDSGNSLVMAETTDGVTFSKYQYSSEIETNGNNNISPGAFQYGSLYYLMYVQNGGNHYLYLTEN